MPQQRLDKLLASTGRWSRKEARDLVRQGRVSVQNRTALREDEKYEDSAPISVDGAPGRPALRASSRLPRKFRKLFFDIFNKKSPFSQG